MEKIPYLTTEEAAEVLGLDPRQVQRLIKAGKLPGAIRAGKGLRAPYIIPTNSVKALHSQRQIKRRAAASKD